MQDPTPEAPRFAATAPHSRFGGKRRRRGLPRRPEARKSRRCSVRRARFGDRASTSGASGSRDCHRGGSRSARRRSFPRRRRSRSARVHGRPVDASATPVAPSSSTSPPLCTCQTPDTTASAAPTPKPYFNVAARPGRNEPVTRGRPKGSRTRKLHAPGKIRTCGLCLRRAALYPLSYGRGWVSVSARGGPPRSARHRRELRPGRRRERGRRRRS